MSGWHFIPNTKLNSCSPGWTRHCSSFLSVKSGILSPCRGKNNRWLKQPANHLVIYDQPGCNRETKWPTVGEFDHSSYCSPIMFIRNVGPFVEGFCYSAIGAFKKILKDSPPFNSASGKYNSPTPQNVPVLTSYTHSYTHFSWAKPNTKRFQGQKPSPFHPSTATKVHVLQPG